MSPRSSGSSTKTEGPSKTSAAFWRTVSGPGIECHLTVNSPEKAVGDRQSLAKSAEEWVSNLLINK